MKKILRSLIVILALVLILVPAALAASLVLYSAERTALATTLATDLSTGHLKIYSGTYATGTLLADLTLPSMSGANVSTGVLTFPAITQVNASQTGTAAYFILFKTDGTTEVCHGDVSTSGRHRQPQHHQHRQRRPGVHHQRHPDRAGGDLT